MSLWLQSRRSEWAARSCRGLRPELTLDELQPHAGVYDRDGRVEARTAGATLTLNWIPRADLTVTAITGLPLSEGGALIWPRTGRGAAVCAVQGVGL